MNSGRHYNFIEDGRTLHFTPKRIDAHVQIVDVECRHDYRTPCKAAA